MNTPRQSFQSTRPARLLAGLAGLLLAALPASAQIDPAPRQLLHLGANTSLTDSGPLGAYAFYYWNMVNVPTTNQVLRLVIAPGYMDNELGFQHLLGEHTDLGVGFFGGLFANNYQEVDHGQWFQDQSFDGNGGGGSLSVYHLFNPDQHIPLNGMLRARLNYESFDKTDATATFKNNSGTPFILPENQPFVTYRTGLRWGGKEPMLGPVLGMEISGWYEVDQRTAPGGYGFGNDRELERVSQRFFARAQLNYTTLESKNYIVASLQGGGTINADRLSAYRLGGVLPYTKEFPLLIPGYYDGELSAKSYGLAYGLYTVPFGSEQQWSLIGMGAAALVDYVDGTGQPGAFNSGVGAGVGYTAPSQRWKVMSLFGYGFEAMRQEGRGGYSFGLAFQYNFGSLQYAGMKAYEQLEQMHTTVTR
ncbi:MAG TPA: hypothetical protein VNN22_13490 [Verrucomicrobiae bacterium]|nr:hypothetical protein [Verrucomicrobiae bacterium]